VRREIHELTNSNTPRTMTGGRAAASASGLIPRRIGSADYAESQRGRDRSGSV
jgi:hypothetical protein